MTSPVYSVSTLNIGWLESQPPKLAITIGGEVSTPGWTGFTLAHRIYIVPPAGGIYEADVVGVPPSGNVIQVITPFSFNEVWNHVPADLKGLKVYSATDSVTTATE
jgi:hypothetical protein